MPRVAATATVGDVSFDARIGRVRLRVADLGRALDFYQRVLGLHDAGGAALGPAGGPPALVELVEERGAPPRPPRTPGLFHFALLVPTRRDLGRALLRFRDVGWRLHGFADHSVSESIYLADPEGNGIEVYADRPREAWTREGDELRMTTDPLDLDDLLAAAGPAEASAGLPQGTVVGHVHLEVSDLAAAEVFYARDVGFDVTVRSYPGARFLAAGGYHHHVAVNVWNGARGRVPAGARGLVDYEIVVPGGEDREALLARLGAGDRIEDPSGIGIRIVEGDEHGDHPAR